MSQYVAKQLRLLEWKPIRINLSRRMKVEQPILCSGFVPPGARLLSLAALRRCRKVGATANAAGVYFLWDEDRLIYVGSSGRIDWRVRYHARSRRMPFTDATYLAIEFPWYLSAEAAYIVAYLPVYNRDFTEKRSTRRF